MKLIPKQLEKKIQEAQESFHITGVGKVEYEYKYAYETSGGVTKEWTATRAEGRGLSYDIVYHETSIKGGVKEKYLGSTKAWGREKVEFE